MKKAYILLLHTAGITLLAAMVGAILFPLFVRAGAKGRNEACATNLRILSRAMRLYAQDNDDRLPTAEAWQDQITAYLPNTREKTYRCPVVLPWLAPPASYAFTGGWTMNR